MLESTCIVPRGLVFIIEKTSANTNATQHRLYLDYNISYSCNSLVVGKTSFHRSKRLSKYGNVSAFIDYKMSCNDVDCRHFEHIDCAELFRPNN
jgi:hypothetical protein